MDHISVDCPFCGMCHHEPDGSCNIEIESSEYWKDYERGEQGTSYCARCCGCGARGPVRYSDVDAEEAWNERGQ